MPISSHVAGLCCAGEYFELALYFAGSVFEQLLYFAVAVQWRIELSCLFLSAWSLSVCVCVYSECCHMKNAELRHSELGDLWSLLPCHDALGSIINFRGSAEENVEAKSSFP